ncbi:MAG TPA: glycosyl transferase family 1, partial [Opitutaceae bacterium]|nr:glycosyl transferase family 1 [Opitutaceae bacterium]
MLLAHPSGNQFFRHLAAALRDAGLLQHAFTCIDWRGGLGIGRFLPAGVRAELARRSFSRDLAIPVVRHAWREAARLTADRLGMRRLTRHEVGPFSVDAVYRDFDRWVARRVERAGPDSIAYAYEDAAAEIFAAVKRCGARCVYDLPIAYWQTSRRLLDEEAVRWPEWEPTLIGTRDSPEKLERKSRELAAADL